MIRTLTLLVLLVGASAWACGDEASGDCNCKRPVKSVKKAPAPAPAKVTQGSELLREIDSAIAGKCNCTSAADCTCKKGSCKCPHCGQKAHPMFQSFEDRGAPLRIPANARRDATAGAFI